MDGWMDRWMGGWVDGWMDGWMDVCMINRNTPTALARKLTGQKPLSRPWLR